MASGATARTQGGRRRPGRAPRKGVRTTEEKLRQQAERYLGTGIRQSEWDDAKAYAERKLAYIIERDGDLGGARREPFYLAQLIAETVSARRLSEFTRQHYDLMQEGIKKDSTRRKTCAIPISTPIVSQTQRECNRRFLE